nr:retrovirus-related Pol polyprotein from transposon TNT 1-94 [Tanacetum cinerariifolium]
QLNERDMNNKSDVFESAFDSSVNESEEDNNQENDRYKAGYHAVPLPYTGNFMPPRPDLSFIGLDDSVFKTAISETVTSVHETETSASKTSKESMEKPKSIRPSSPIIEDWESDSDDDSEIRPSIEQNKPRKCVLNNEGKATGQRKVRPVWYNAQRVNHHNFSNNLTHHHPRRNFIPTEVITNSVITNLGKVPVNTAKQSFPRAASSTSTARYVNTAATRPTVNGAKTSLNVFHESHSPVRRTFNQRTSPKNSDLKETNNNAKNRVLVIKPHNKTPYELLIGRSPNLDFMRPFGYPVTILNTLDHLGKFEGKADEGFLVEYSVNRRGLEWLFNIDSLKKYMNYEQVTVGNQTNDDAGLEINVNVGQDGQEKASDHEYILLPFMPSHAPLSSSIQSSDDKDVDEAPDKGDEGVWNLVDLPNGKRAIGTKWVFRNKKDEKGIVVRNKARLVAQGYTQEEGIDYDKMYVKSAFLYGAIEEEVYVCQPLGFKYPHFLNKVYKVEKALYGIHQAPKAWYETLSAYLLENGFRRGLQVKQKDDGIFISQDKYMADILKKFDFTTVKIASTPMEPNKALIKDAEAEDVDVYLYISVIGSLMYLTDSKPDIMFVVCACARFQVTPKTSHLYVVKRIFRYLKVQTKLGLWYPRDSSFNLEAFFYSDYAGASLDRKSTT